MTTKTTQKDDDAIAFARIEKLFRTLPSVDASSIRSTTLPQSELQLNANIFAFHNVGLPGQASDGHGPWAHTVGNRLRIVQLDVHGDRAEAVVETEVTNDMCNVFGSMAGSCGAYLFDHVSAGTMVCLGRAKGFDGRGLSTTMNIHWHGAATAGTTLLISTHTLFHSSHTRTRSCLVRGEIREKHTGRLILSGTHGFVNAGRARESKL
ncbi:4HBT domain-containing protein [Mycena kentingensis (nom. inval.)]|nr:4HBT domain-containing protein [Mycena kentingensis (nom. inval.)]